MLEDLLEEYGVWLLKMSEEDSRHMEEEFSLEEIKKAISPAKVSSAPGQTRQTIVLYKYRCSVILQTLT
jgi:hypothetical protein